MPIDREPSRLDGWPAPLRRPLRPILGALRRILALARRATRPLRPSYVARTLRWIGSARADLTSRSSTPKLTVAVDISPFWEPLTGVGWYLYLLLRSLAERQDLVLRLYGPDFVSDERESPPEVEPPRGAAVDWVRHRVPDDLCLPAWMLVRALRLVEPWLVAADRNRVLFAPNFFLPRRLRRSRGALVATVHDLAFRHFPWTLRDATLRDLEQNLGLTLGRARRLITPSATVRQELVESYDLEPERVVSVHHGPGHLLFTTGQELPPDLEPGYALHVGTLEPRKNLSVVMEAWRLLLGRGVSVPPLVLCGGFGWKSEELRRSVEEGEREGWVRYLGYVDDDLLKTLYAAATLVVCPSLYEGFGLPVVEALWSGVPVVCSDIPVFREVAGEGARFVEPGRATAWAETVEELLSHDERRAELGRRGREVATRLDWAKAAEETVAVWRAAGATVAG